MNSVRSASIILEVLVSMVILFMTVFVVTASIKRLGQVYDQKAGYEALYTTFFSVVDAVDMSICDTDRHSGKLNGFSYTLVCTQLQEKTTENDHMVTLVRLDLHFKKAGLDKSFVRYKTLVKAVPDATQ